MKKSEFSQMFISIFMERHKNQEFSQRYIYFLITSDVRGSGLSEQHKMAETIKRNKLLNLSFHCRWRND